MTSKELFISADEATAALKTYAEALFSNMLTLMPFDEINMAGAEKYVGPAFKKLNAKCKKLFEQIAKESYRKFYVGKLPRKDFGEAIGGLLKSVNHVTEYSYDSEWERKESRLKESISITGGDVMKRREVVAKSLKHVFGQIEQYNDNALVLGMMLAFTDMGVEQVEFHTQEDERVCDDCEPLDGNIYELAEAPELPLHYRCRCYYTRVKDDI